MDATPLVPWDADSDTHPDLVWRAKLDGRYLVEASRDTGGDDPAYRGRLRIYDHDHEMAVLLDDSIGFAYGSLFGPDVLDIEGWKERAMQIVDAQAPGS